ncbi:MAG: hypothetical protein HY582_03595 [Candidatus Omnitrophica bacterium]|nr:hypothetical protein [Candidatus Omnitrophota bacterium]
MKVAWKPSWHWVVIFLLIGFALGTIFGERYAKESFHRHWKKGDAKQHMLERFSKKLDLTAEQREKVATVFEAKHPEMLALQEEVKPKFDALRNSTQAEIRKLLSPEQQKKLDEMNAKREERRKERQKFFSL